MKVRCSSNISIFAPFVHHAHAHWNVAPFSPPHPHPPWLSSLLWPRGIIFFLAPVFIKTLWTFFFYLAAACCEGNYGKLCDLKGDGLVAVREGEQGGAGVILDRKSREFWAKTACYVPSFVFWQYFTGAAWWRWVFQEVVGRFKLRYCISWEEAGG
jgi:hypothetical protein